MGGIKFIFSFGFLLLLAALFIGCSQPFNYPDEEVFSLSANVSKTELKIGEDLDVTGVLKNTSESDYKFINSSASFSDSGLIAINVVKVNEPELFFVGASIGGNIDSKSEIIENNKFKMKENGTYKVIVTANFDIENPSTKEIKSYNYKVEPIIIEVK